MKITAAHAPLRGVGPIGPDIMMIGIQSVTLMTQDQTQDDVSPSEELTEVEPTAMAAIWTVRVEAGPSYLAPSVLVESSARLISRPTSDWLRESVNSQESPSPKHGLTTTEWQSRSEEETTMSL